MPHHSCCSCIVSIALSSSLCHHQGIVSIVVITAASLLSPQLPPPSLLLLSHCQLPHNCCCCHIASVAMQSFLCHNIFAALSPQPLLPSDCLCCGIAVAIALPILLLFLPQLCHSCNGYIIIGVNIFLAITQIIFNCQSCWHQPPCFCQPLCSCLPYGCHCLWLLLLLFFLVILSLPSLCQWSLSDCHHCCVIKGRNCGFI